MSEKHRKILGYGILIGVCSGVVLGSIFDDMARFVGLGCSFGLLGGAAYLKFRN